MKYKADIGVFGGSGFYSFLDNVEEISIETPYGNPSDKIAIAEYAGKKIAFLPRHGKDHQFAPDTIPYRANIYAMKSLGVKKIIAPTASGSLKSNIKPGEFVICDQFVNFTWGRQDTYYNDKNSKNEYLDVSKVWHTSSANPYCKDLCKTAAKAGSELKINVHSKGTVVVIQGPRFSTVSESRMFASHGFEVINMTQYPECYLAREMGICYANIALITDYDAGLEDDPTIPPVTHDEVIEFLNKNTENVKDMLFKIINNIDLERECDCCK